MNAQISTQVCTNQNAVCTNQSANLHKSTVDNFAQINCTNQSNFAQISSGGVGGVLSESSDSVVKRRSWSFSLSLFPFFRARADLKGCTNQLWISAQISLDLHKSKRQLLLSPPHSLALARGGSSNQERIGGRESQPAVSHLSSNSFERGIQA